MSITYSHLFRNRLSILNLYIVLMTFYYKLQVSNRGVILVDYCSDNSMDAIIVWVYIFIRTSLVTTHTFAVQQSLNPLNNFNNFIQDNWMSRKLGEPSGVLVIRKTCWPGPLTNRLIMHVLSIHGNYTFFGRQTNPFFDMTVFLTQPTCWPIVIFSNLLLLKFHTQTFRQPSRSWNRKPTYILCCFLSFSLSTHFTISLVLQNSHFR